MKSYLDTDNEIFTRNFNVNFAKLPKDKSSTEISDILWEQLMTYYEIYHPFLLPLEKLKEFIKIHNSICPNEGYSSWNYVINEFAKISGGEIKETQNQTSSSKAKSIENKNNEMHEKCLKAADYKGCMNYQSKTQ